MCAPHSFRTRHPDSYTSGFPYVITLGLLAILKEIRVSHRLIRTLVVLALFVSLPGAADVLFPTPLHLTRRVHESIGGGTTVVEQYCYGNRVITVRGPITTIADYDKSELTEIDRESGTYSISRFDQVAKALNPKALQATSQSTTAGAKKTWELRNVGRANALSARSTEVFEADRKDEAVTRHVRIGIDSSVALSKDALDVITGSAFPANPKEEDAAIASAAKGHAPAIASQSTNGARQADRYGLPVEQLFRFEVEGQQAEYRDIVVRVGAEIPPADLVAIPAGAKLVESRLITTSRMVDAIDRLPLDGLKKQ